MRDAGAAGTGFNPAGPCRQGCRAGARSERNTHLPDRPSPEGPSVAGDGPSDDPLPPVAAWVPRIRTRHLLTRARLIDAVAVNVWNGELIERRAPDLGTAREDDTETRTPRLSKHATLFNLDPGD